MFFSHFNDDPDLCEVLRNKSLALENTGVFLWKLMIYTRGLENTNSCFLISKPHVRNTDYTVRIILSFSAKQHLHMANCNSSTPFVILQFDNFFWHIEKHIVKEISICVNQFWQKMFLNLSMQSVTMSEVVCIGNQMISSAIWNK